MTPAFSTTATTTDGMTLTLDTPAPVGSGRVRVTVEPVAAPQPLKLLEFLDQLQKDQQARGHVPRTREEIDASVSEERAGWDHRS